MFGVKPRVKFARKQSWDLTGKNDSKFNTTPDPKAFFDLEF